MSRSKEVDPRDEVVASFPGAGIEMIMVDIAFAITGQEPLIGFVLTRGGDLKPVTAESVYDGDDVAVFLHPSGQVSWPHVETWPSLLDFKNAMAHRRAKVLAVLERIIASRQEEE